jgi:hypothetical protein
MKSMKSIYSFLKKIRMAVTKNHYLGFAFVKAIALAAVFFPCALQAGAITPVEKGQYLDDSGAVLFKRGTQDINGCDAIMKCCNLGSKSSLELKGAVTQQRAALAPMSKAVISVSDKTATNNGDDSSDNWWFYLILPLPILAALWPQPNVK